MAEIDLRVGGKWRYVMVADGGFEVGFHGEYREIVPSERLVSTEFFEGVPEGVSEEDATTVNTATFTESDGRTTLTLLVQAPNKETRDAIVESGMRRACRTPWTSWKRSRSRFAERVAGVMVRLGLASARPRSRLKRGDLTPG